MFVYIYPSIGGNGVGADEGGSAWLSDCQLLANKQCGAMASGLNAFISFSKCVASKNGTHGTQNAEDLYPFLSLSFSLSRSRSLSLARSLLRFKRLWQARTARPKETVGILAFFF